MSTQTLSKQSQKNWWVDLALFFSTVIVSLSGIYFLFLPVGGFQGGRNPFYNVQIVFDRSIWDILHTWSGVTMIVVALIHLVFHWRWVVSMTRRIWKELTGKSACMNVRGYLCLVLNVIVIVSFVLTAVSGVYFLFFSVRQGVADPMVVFSRITWDLIHTWAGVVFMSTAMIHFVIHWAWITRVTPGILGISRPACQPVSGTNLSVTQ